jgi:hypothetical protein
MHDQVDRDESLVDINYSLLKSYYSQLKFLLILTIVAIVCNVIALWFNATTELTIAVFIVPIISSLAVLVASIVFVVDIVDPEKYRKRATKLAKEFLAESQDDEENSSENPIDSIDEEINVETYEEKPSEPSKESLLKKHEKRKAHRKDSRDFQRGSKRYNSSPYDLEFAKLETSIRKLWEINNPDKSASAQLSVPNMINDLVHSRKISPGVAREIMSLNKLHNLVNHGNFDDFERKHANGMNLAYKRLDLANKRILKTLDSKI